MLSTVRTQNSFEIHQKRETLMQTIHPPSAVTQSKVNWPQVAWFLSLTFSLTWLVDLALYLNGGLTNPAAALLMQFQMLLPAFSAMFLGCVSNELKARLQSGKVSFPKPLQERKHGFQLTRNYTRRSGTI
jgi:hypothetical protein